MIIMKTKNHLKIFLTTMRFCNIPTKPLSGLIFALLLLPLLSFAQNTAINQDNSDAHPSAMLDVKSSDKGFLTPRMTADEIASIDNPANGLIVFSTTDNKFYAYILSEDIWKEIAYSATPTWACGDLFHDDRDGKAYNTVQIDTQCWMAENLNMGTMISGSSNQTDNATIEKYCYNNSTANCDTYGGLYQWDEMMGYVTTEGAQGICPTGWHIPTDAEWCTLENEVDAGTVSCSFVGYRGVDVGGNLKEAGTSHWTNPNSGATNSSGFTGLPGGYRVTNGSFYYLGWNGMYWTSSEDGSSAWKRFLDNPRADIARSTTPKPIGFSARCIKN